MKSTVEQLSPTRVRINVEVPFAELEPDFARTYKSLAQQVRIPGFRPGKAPAKLLEARIGRGTILTQVINEALPERYTEAVNSSNVKALGTPDIEITKMEDGRELTFTAEVDVRPEITLPDYAGLSVTVDPITVSESDVDSELLALRQRFGTLVGVARPVRDGDFVSIDLAATADGEPVPEASAEGLSHEVGSGALVDGLDEALVGMSVGESKEFPSTLVAGGYAGKRVMATVSVGSVKERELPEVDDEFIQVASAFDTLDELRTDLGGKVERNKKYEQAGQIRDRALEALVDAVDVPLPEATVQAEVDAAVADIARRFGVDRAGLDAVLEAQNSSKEEFEAESRRAAERSVKAQLLLDAVADAEGTRVEQEELTERLLFDSQRYGMAPEEYLRQLQQAGQLGALFGDIRRTKALIGVVDRVQVTDTEGAAVDVRGLFGTNVGEQDTEAVEAGNADAGEPEGPGADFDAEESTEGE